MRATDVLMLRKGALLWEKSVSVLGVSELIVVTIKVNS